jgi:RNA polymerase sigma factor (sigma-70 family)
MPAVVPPDAERDADDRGAILALLHAGEAQALFGFVRRLGLTDEQADDAVQEVFARMLDVGRQGVSIANPRSWAYRAIYRLAMDQHRLRARIVALVGRLADRPDRGPQPDAADRIAVWAEVNRLPARQRHVIYLRYRADLPYEEIGAILGISASAARSHATQAIATMRSRLDTGIEEMTE